MKIKLIAALSINNVIGVDNHLPWNLPAEWRYFREITQGAPFVMGRKSYENPDALLSDVHNYILTRQEGLTISTPQTTPAHSLTEALALCRGEEEVFILGGASVFAEAMEIADYLYLSLVHAVIAGDTYFPEVNWFNWQLVQSQRRGQDAENEYSFAMNVYRKKNLTV